MLEEPRWFTATLFISFVLCLPAIGATVSFKPAQTYSVGTNPTAVAVGDFNGDGKPDLAVVNNGSNDVSILLGKGDGTFQTARNFDAGSSAWTYGIAVEDFNGDGNIDVAVLIPPNGASPAEVRILMGNGDGTLKSPLVTTLTSQETIVTVVDVNGDKKGDLMANFSDANGQAGVEILLGNGDGTFQTPKTVVSGQQQVLVAVADFDHDDKADLAIGLANSVQIMLGKGDGTFLMAGSSSIADGYSANSAWTGDVNGDGSPDLIVASLGPLVRCGLFGYCPSTQESVFLSEGKGALGAEQVIATTAPVAVGDFDGDGKLDIAGRIVGFIPSLTKFLIYPGNGDGTFAQAITFPYPGHVVVGADLNGDGLADLIALDAANNSIDVLLNATPAFSMTASTNTLTANAGEQVTDTLSLTGVNGFSSTLQLSCQVVGPAPAPTCSLSPASITAGASSSTSTLTISVPTTSAGLVSSRSRWGLQPLYALAFPFAFVGLGFRKRVDPRYKLWLLTACLATAALLSTACGGGSSNTQSVHQSQSYTVQVTAASDSLTKAMQISLNVQ